jgi:hypothetical protein
MVLIVAMVVAPNGIQGGLRWVWAHRPWRDTGTLPPPDDETTSDQSNATERKRRSDAKTTVEA